MASCLRARRAVIAALRSSMGLDRCWGWWVVDVISDALLVRASVRAGSLTSGTSFAAAVVGLEDVVAIPSCPVLGGIICSLVTASFRCPGRSLKG